jgi:serine/threonine-protein kinase
MVLEMIPREGTLIADRYRLERKVGGGRVSAVWRVRDEISSRPCAIKILHRTMHKHPEALTRFSLEDRLARELTGPHFPERVGSGVWDGMRYIAWRWHEGESLRALFERNPKQDAPTVHSIIQETCQALSLVHAAGYAHGDLKPENILFTDRGESGRSSRQIKLLGFGVASRLSRPSAAGFGVGRRRPGELVGTPLYSSPDLILGRVPSGGQADLWALAAIVYEALTGRPPFLGFDIGAVLQAILDKRAPRPSSVADNLPGSFDAWWAQALAQEFDTPSEFAGALARALAPALRTSHTQRSASLPDRSPSPLEAVTPMPPRAPRGKAATTVSGIGPTDIGLARVTAAAKAAKGATAAPAASAAVSPAAVSPAVTPGVTSPGATSPAVTSPAAGSAAAAASSPALAAPLASPVAPAAPAPAAASAAARAARVAAPHGAAAPPATSVPGAGPAAALAAAAPTSPAPEVPAPASAAAAALPTAPGGVAPAPVSPAVVSPAAVAPAITPAAAASPAAASPAAVAPAAAADTASAPLTPGVPPLAHDASRAQPPANDTFVPFPSPLRDLGAGGARKTLVGITPPSLLQSIASAVGAKPAPAAPLAGAAAPARGAPSAKPNQKTIEGAPCKPIETTGDYGAFDLGAFDSLRRPANPTVPFPRPRAAQRTATLPNPSDETPDIGRASWHGTTTRTLRFVLTSPDHKPQRVAAVVVCAAAALVIFAVGRSPVAGTAGIGQTTGALSADPNQKAAPAAPRSAPETSPELEKASGSDRKDPKLDAPEKVDAPQGPAASPELDEPAGDELAPGLVLPATGRAGAGSNPSRARSPEPAASNPKARPAAAPTPAAKQVVKKAPPAPPPPRSLPPTPARQNSTELDFGI